MIRYEINQTIVPLRFRLDGRWLRRLLRTTERQLHLHGTRTLSIAFVDQRTMQRLNRSYRHKNRATDILAFQLPPAFGELVLAWPYIRNQAQQNKKPLTEELALLLIHGVLHLLGYDHETKKDAAKMLPLQQKILKDFLRV